MSDPIRTPAEALEAAAQCYENGSGVWPEEWDTFASAAAAIRALAPRIPPVPDDEALVERCARAMNSAWCHAPEGTPDWGFFWSMHRDQYRKQARAVLAALREAGALR